MGGEDAEKSHEPTQKKLDDARAKGQIARSQDILTAASMGGFLLAALFAGPALRASATAGMAGIEQAGTPVSPLGVALAMTVPLLPLLLLPALPVVALLVMQRAVIFTPENLMPRLSRIDPVAGAARRLGGEGLVEFAKGVLKLLLVGAILFHFLASQADAILSSPTLWAGQATAKLLRLTLDFLLLAFAVTLVLGGVDLLLQTFLHLRRNRMTHRELVDEHRESEGDPHSRAARRQRAQDIALNRMMQDVPTADVVIVNPTHYAVALKWNRADGRAPVCVAKGLDEVAARIRARAVEAGVPVHSDPPTARAIYATVDLGQPVRPDHYRPVAAAIRFAEAMRRRRRTDAGR